MQTTTKGAQAAPLSFSELKAQATKGPFEASNHYVHAKGTRFLVVAGDSDGLPAATNAELITRLLNWAHTGGVEALEDALSESVNASTYPDGPNLPKETRDKLRAALAILDGK